MTIRAINEMTLLNRLVKSLITAGGFLRLIAYFHTAVY